MIIINNSSMIPIYEQIVNQVKQNIVDGKLKEGDGLVLKQVYFVLVRLFKRMMAVGLMWIGLG